MALYLTLTVAFLAFFIGIKDWMKTKWPTKVNRIEKGFLWASFGIALLTSIIAYVQTKDGEKQEKNINDILSGVKGGVDTAKLNRAVASINKTTDKIYAITGEINDSLSNMMIAKDSLISQYTQVNDKLKKQIDIENKLLAEREPNIVQYPTDIKWLPFDSEKYFLSITLSNVGGRSCDITKSWGGVYFLNESRKPFFTMKFPRTITPSTIPLRSNNVGHFMYSNYINPFPYFQKNTFIALIFIGIEYKDPLTNKKYEKKFYRIWSPKIGFGHTADSEIPLTNDLLKQYPDSSGIIK